MITESEYKKAVAEKEAAEKIIQAYLIQEDTKAQEIWDAFLRGEKDFTDDELIYSAGARCKCGAGLAYMKDCPDPLRHQWSCSDVLKGKIRKFTMEEHPSYPFAFYEIKSEDQPSAQGHTTRPKA